ncbi:MAG: GNAT family N-acetyltransferase [Bacteroides sp.]|nr:GNAT family N-acetyltransferase [Bacteroides sp.]
MTAKATEADLSDILKLQQDAFLLIALGMNNLSIQPMVQTYESLLEEFHKGTILTYTSDNRIVSSVRAYTDEANNCQVGKLIVHPDYQKRGIAGELMLGIESFFPCRNSFKLFTGLVTPHTARFYEKLGYRKTHFDEVNGTRMVFMEKPNPFPKEKGIL